MPRRYMFLEGDPSKLAGWTFTMDRRDGHGPIMWPTAMRQGDAYPHHMVLCAPVGDSWQLCSVSDREEHQRAAEAAIEAAASKAGLTVHADATALEKARPSRADAYLYDREPVLDRDGKPTGATRKVPGAKLRCAMVMAGDDPVASAAKPESVESVERIR